MTSFSIAPAGLLRRRSASVWRSGWTWVVSFALHAALAAVFGGWVMRSWTTAATRSFVGGAENLVGVELPIMTEASLAPTSAMEGQRDPVGVLPRLSGGDVVARVDTGRNGRGGDPTVDRAATNLSDVDDRLRLMQGTLSRTDRDQVQRVRSDVKRASWEDRRALLDPMELTFLSAGEMERVDRSLASVRNPSRGVLVAAPGSILGGMPGAAETAGTEVAGPSGAARAGVQAVSPGEGVRDGLPGSDHRASGRAALARPDVARAEESNQARVKGKSRDDVDAEQEIAARVRALVHASTAGGVLAAEGRGGVAGPGAPGALGQSGPGSHPTPLGDGTSDWFDLGSTDPRVVTYLRRFHAKVQPLWASAFPRSAAVDLQQGTVILAVTIDADGAAHVSWPPLRPSGVDEFDRNCAEAVRKASPFDPIPRELGLTALHIRTPFTASNPMVH